jgi:DNA-binding Lrp family transcriptional regulator
MYDETLEKKPSMLAMEAQLQGYRFYRQVPSNKKITTKRKDKWGNPIQITLNQKEYYSIEDIEQFNFESYSKLLPYMNGHKTIVHNYFIKFWAPVLDPKQRSGGNIAFLYITLLSYCYGEKDYVWVSVSTLGETINASEETVRKYLKILEEEGFIIRFWREKENEEEKTEQGSLLIKIRRTIPFLTKEKLEKLSPRKQAEHERFLRSIKLESQVEFEQAYQYTQALEEFREKAIEVKEPSDEGHHHGDMNELKKYLSEEEYLPWLMVLKRIEQKVSKESFQQWFAQTVGIRSKQDHWIIYCAHPFIRDRLETHYMDLIEEAIDELMLPKKKIKIQVYKSR